MTSAICEICGNFFSRRFTKIKKAGLEKPDFSDLHRPPRFFIALNIGPLKVHTSLKLKMKIDFAKE
jgi:hypothetical protein